MEIEYYKPCPEYDRCCELIDRYWEAGEYEACFKGHLELAEQGYPLAECLQRQFFGKSVLRLSRRQMHIVIQLKHLLRERRIIRKHARRIVIHVKSVRHAFHNDRTIFVSTDDYNDDAHEGCS